MTNEHTYLEKYTTHFIRKGCKRVMCDRWAGDWKKIAAYSPPPSYSFSSSTSFSFCWAAQTGRGSLRAQLSAGSGSHCLEPQQFTPNSKLTRTSCGTGLYNCLTATCFSARRICTKFNPSTVKGIPPISSSGFICYLHRCISYLTARPGRRSICYIYISK